MAGCVAGASLRAGGRGTHAQQPPAPAHPPRPLPATCRMRTGYGEGLHDDICQQDCRRTRRLHGQHGGGGAASHAAPLHSSQAFPAPALARRRAPWRAWALLRCWPRRARSFPGAATLAGRTGCAFAYWSSAVRSAITDSSEFGGKLCTTASSCHGCAGGCARAREVGDRASVVGGALALCTLPCDRGAAITARAATTSHTSPAAVACSIRMRRGRLRLPGARTGRSRCWSGPPATGGRAYPGPHN